LSEIKRNCGYGNRKPSPTAFWGVLPTRLAVVGQDLRIIIVNKAFERTFTLTEGVSAGKEIGEIIPVPGLIAAISKVFACGDFPAT